MGKKLELTWPPGTQEAVKERMRAIVWCVSQHGGWRSSNVTADITKWLAEDGYEMDQDRVAAMLVRLDAEGYIIRVVQGKRTTEVELVPDLTVPVPAYVRARLARGAAAESRQPAEPPAGMLIPSGVPMVTTNGAAPARSRRRPPLPNQTPPPVFNELAKELARWWRDEPEAATDYVVDALGALREL